MESVWSALGNITLSLLASSIWVGLGYVVYRRERQARRKLSFFSLYANLDRTRDTLNALGESLARFDDWPARLPDVELLELWLQRNIEAFQFEWLIQGLPHETEGVVWMHDLHYVLGNARELVNELASVRTAVLGGTPPDELEENRARMTEVCAELIEAIDGEMKLVPQSALQLE